MNDRAKINAGDVLMFVVILATGAIATPFILEMVPAQGEVDQMTRLGMTAVPLALALAAVVSAGVSGLRRT